MIIAALDQMTLILALRSNPKETPFLISRTPENLIQYLSAHYPFYVVYLVIWSASVV